MSPVIILIAQNNVLIELLYNIQYLLCGILGYMLLKPWYWKIKWYLLDNDIKIRDWFKRSEYDKK